MIITILSLFLISALLLLLEYRVFKKAKPGLAVISYTCIGQAPHYSTDTQSWISVQDFKKQLNYLRTKGYNFVTPEDVLKNNLKPKDILLTFNHGYENFYTTAAPILEELKIPALIFLTVGGLNSYDFWHTGGPWQNMLTAAQIKTLKKSSLFAFGSMGFSGKKLATLNAEALNNEVNESAHRLNTLLKIKPDFFKYPFPGDDTLEAAARSAASAYKLQFTQACGTNPLPINGGIIKTISVSTQDSLFDLHLKVQGKK